MIVDESIEKPDADSPQLSNGEKSPFMQGPPQRKK